MFNGIIRLELKYQFLQCCLGVSSLLDAKAADLMTVIVHIKINVLKKKLIIGYQYYGIKCFISCFPNIYKL